MAMFGVTSKSAVRIASGYLAAMLCCTHAMSEEASQIPVTVKKFSELAIYPVRDAPAAVVSLNDTRVSSEINGLLQDISVRVGDRVEKGDVIATIDCQDHDITLTQAKAALEAGRAKFVFDRAQLEKARKLSKKKNISGEELDRRASNASVSRAEVDRLTAALKAAKRSVDKCAVHAPFKAVIIQRIASLGDYLVRGTPILRLLDQEDIEISARVQEQDLESLRQAEEVLFVDYRRTYSLRLRTIIPLVESRLRSYEVRLTFAADEAPPGSAGRLEWQSPEPHLPSDLLVTRNGTLGVFFENAGYAQFTLIENAQEGRPAPVSLPGETAVIVDGRFGLTDGSAVEIVEP